MVLDSKAKGRLKKKINKSKVKEGLRYESKMSATQYGR
jgi:hypothetical protein